MKPTKSCELCGVYKEICKQERQRVIEEIEEKAYRIGTSVSNSEPLEFDIYIHINEKVWNKIKEVADK